MEKEKKNKKMSVSTRNAHIFCICVLAFMLIQWAIFFVYGNINNVMLAFQHYDGREQVFYKGSELFTNFKNYLHDLFKDPLISGYFLTGCAYHLTGLAALPISLMFSFVIYKKMPGAGLYKIVLFLPTVISGMVIALLFNMFMLDGMEGIWVELLHKDYIDFQAPLTSEKWAFPSLLLYQFFFALPGSLLINLGSMSRIPDDLVEYGRLEGLSYFQEFMHLTMPLMFPILQIYCLGIFTGFFGASGPLYAIYSDGSTKHPPQQAISFGYYMMSIVISDNSLSGVKADYMYGYTTAGNLMVGLVSCFIVYGTKKLFDRFDPEADF